MTIGRPQGAVWIGKPIDVVIPVSLDEAEAGGSLCLGADVVQGDTPMLDRRVTVSLESGGSPGNSNIRVRSTAPVEEPVVTVTVRAGCDMKSTRTYTLLADVPSDAALPVVVSSSARSIAEPAATQRSAPRASARGANGSGGASAFDNAPTGSSRRSEVSGDSERVVEAPAPRRAVPPAASIPRRAAPVQVQAPPRPPPPERVAAPPPKPKPAVAGGSHLRVEALEPEPTKEAGLKPTAELNLPPTPDMTRRAAAAALWNALSPSAEGAKPEPTRSVNEAEANQVKELEATLKALREQTTQNQRALNELRSELVQARESQYRNPLVYALIALLLLALFGLVLVWRLARQAAAPAWWNESMLKGEDGPGRTGKHSGVLDGGMEVDPDEQPNKQGIGAPTFGSTPSASPEEEGGDGAPVVQPPRALDGAPARPVNTEELFDVQQQSDFFLSLGQHDQAIAVLREHIAANPGTSALAYLDLLRIFHALERREDYAQLAEEFERAFNADVPAFEKFGDAGRGLEHYRSALARIESQWPAPSTLALIEELIFRRPGTHEDGAFDLAAYQELLLLYSIAKEVIDPEAALPLPVAPNAFEDTYGREGFPTATIPMQPEAAPPVMQDGPTLPPSIYHSIDDRLHHDTIMVPEELDPPTPVRPSVELDLAEFDKTAYETMPTPIEPPKPAGPTAKDPHIIDFELFDPATEAEIAPKPIKR